MKWVRKGIRLYEAANRGQIDLLASNLEYFGGLQSVFSQNSKKPIRTTIPSERISSVDYLHSDQYRPNQQSSAPFSAKSTPISLSRAMVRTKELHSSTSPPENSEDREAVQP